MTTMAASKRYSEIFPITDSSSSDRRIDADVIVIGAGIAGASIAHHCALDEQCRVVVLEQFDFGNNDNKSNSKDYIHHGSSRGGPRRIGTIGNDERTCRAWDMWMTLNNNIRHENDHKNSEKKDDNDLLDVCGEVYVFALFPIGILFLVLVGLFTVHNAYISSKKGKGFPDGFQILWTPRMIGERLGPRQGFRGEECWSGCVGIYYKEAAALHSDRILRYFLHNQASSTADDINKKNLEVRYGSTATSIDFQPNEDDNCDPKTVIITVSSSSGGHASYQLSCRHLVVAAGGWSGKLLKGFFQAIPSDQSFDLNKIQDTVEVFTCPVYTVKNPEMDTGSHRINTASPSERPLPFTQAAECPLFSCVHKKMYGFPVNHTQPQSSVQLYIRPFYKAFESTDDPDDQRQSPEQRALVDDFCKACFDKDVFDNMVTFSHSYTCRYPKLSLDGGRSHRPVFDFVPGSHRQIVVVAGLDGYSFKFGSLYGVEFLELLQTGKGPKGLEWPVEDGRDRRGTVSRLLHRAFQKLAGYALTSKENEGGRSEKNTKKE